MTQTLTDPASLEEITEITEEMLDEMIATIGLESMPAVSPEFDAHGVIEVSVSIHGVEEAGLVMRVEAGAAVALTSALIGVEADLDDAVGTAAEFANVLAGSLKSLIEEETSLGVPASVTLPGTSLGELESGVIIDHALGRFELSVTA